MNKKKSEKSGRRVNLSGYTMNIEREIDMNHPIFTDAKGRPIDRPVVPGPNASPEERIAYIRAIHAYNDAVTDLANSAFDKAFRAAMRVAE